MVFTQNNTQNTIKVAGINTNTYSHLILSKTPKTYLG
jgi:hypothetical protein